MFYQLMWRGWASRDTCSLWLQLPSSSRVFGSDESRCFQPDRVLQQAEEVAGHGQPAAGLPSEYRQAGERLHRVSRHLQKVRPHLQIHLQGPDGGAAACLPQPQTEVGPRDLWPLMHVTALHVGFNYQASTSFCRVLLFYSFDFPAVIGRSILHGSNFVFRDKTCNKYT